MTTDTYELKFSVTGQYIDCLDYVEPASDTRGYLTAAFTFDTLWDGLRRLAVFTVAGRSNPLTCTVALDAADACIIPAEVLTSDCRVLGVGVIGYREDGYRLTTNICTITQHRSCLIEGKTPPPPAPDFYIAMREAVTEAERAAVAAEETDLRLHEAADAGAFNGRDGLPGVRGERGYSGLLPHVTRGATDAMTLAANHVTSITPLEKDITLALSPGEEGYANEWAFTVTQGEEAFAVNLPAVRWGLGIEPHFPPNSITLCRLYYLDSILCGEWVSV